MTALYVALGSAIGGLARYCISLALRPVSGFPVGTLVVNIAGSLMIGLFSGLFARYAGGGATMRAFAITGICGGFTTFSTFAAETFQMLEQGRYLWSAVYVAASVVAGIASVWAGYMIAK